MGTDKAHFLWVSGGNEVSNELSCNSLFLGLRRKAAIEAEAEPET